MPKINFKIVTPERVVLEEEVDQVTLPTKQGQITILSNHLPLVSALQPGEIILKSGDKEIPLAVSGGFIEVLKNNVTILADTAERVEEIEISRAEEGRKKAAALLKEKRTESADYAALAAKLEKELARLRVVRKHKRTHLGE